METKKLNKKDIQKSFWLWTFFSHSNYNYERMQSSGFLFSMMPILKKLYGNDKKELVSSYKRHLEFFNTEPHFGGIIGGLVIALEEQKSQNGEELTGDAINSLKTGLMGPLAGVGDTLWQGTIVPILLSIAISIGSQGNLLAPVFYTVAMFAIMLSIGYFLWMRGYTSGSEGIQSLMAGDSVDKVMSIAKIMGATVIGALTANYVSLSTPLSFNMDNLSLSLQTDILDQLFKGILPLSITFLAYYLLNKGMKSTTVLAILIGISIVGATVGIL